MAVVIASHYRLCRKAVINAMRRTSSLGDIETEGKGMADRIRAKGLRAGRGSAEATEDTAGGRLVYTQPEGSPKKARKVRGQGLSSEAKRLLGKRQGVSLIPGTKERKAKLREEFEGR